MGYDTLVKVMWHFLDLAAMELDALRARVESRGFYNFEKKGNGTIYLKHKSHSAPSVQLPVGGDDEVIELQVSPTLRRLTAAACPPVAKPVLESVWWRRWR